MCDCNGYNTVCDTSRGNCTCLDAGVTGTTCTLCKGVENYRGNASNFCYCELINNVKLSTIHNVCIIFLFFFQILFLLGLSILFYLLMSKHRISLLHVLEQ